MSKRAALYLRQSEDVAEGIERQRERSTALAEAKGWAIVATYIDNATSASKDRGPGTDWSKMLDAARLDEFDVIVSVDLDRLLRRTSELVTLIDIGVAVVTVDGEIDLSTADGEFRASMLAAIARFEVRRKSERQKRANNFRVSEGRPTIGGRRRFGFLADHVTVVPSEAEWVLRLHEGVSKGRSLRSLAADLNDAGVPCVTKGRWNAPRVAKIVKNPAYRGEVIHHGRAWPSEVIPLIVGPELAGRVDAVMADPARRKTQGSDRKALLGGLGTCGTCGAALVTAGTGAKGSPIGLYTCSAMKTGQVTTKGHPAIRRAILDRAVVDAVVAAFVMGKASDFAAHGGNDAATVNREIADLATRKANLIGLVGSDSGVTMSDISGELRDIAKAVEAAGSRKAKLEAESAHARMLSDIRAELFSGPQVSIEDAAALAVEMEARFEALTLDERRALVRDLLHVVVNPGRGAGRIAITHLVVKSLNGPPVLELHNSIPSM